MPSFPRWSFASIFPCSCSVSRSHWPPEFCSGYGLHCNCPAPRPGKLCNRTHAEWQVGTHRSGRRADRPHPLLLAAAGSAMKGFARLLHEPLGYDPHNVIALGLPLHENTYTSWAGRGAYFEQLRARIAETPGVTSAAISTSATPPENDWNGRFEILGRPASEEQLALIELVSPGVLRDVAHTPTSRTNLGCYREP